MTRVALTSVRDGVDEAFSRAMEISGCEGLVQVGSRVLIKPNWNACGPSASTSVAAVQAACRWVAAQGAAEVVVGEGPVPVGRPAILAYLEEMGIPECLEQVGASWALFDDEQHVLFHDYPDLPPEIGIARRVLDCDVMINLPLLKVSSNCVVTLCVKNLKGCLRPQDKKELHRVGLLPAIVALNGLVRPQINVVDAIAGMEGDHHRGELATLGMLIAGQDPVAVDAVACSQIRIDPEEVPLLRLVERAGLGTARLEEIELVGELIQPRRFELSQEHIERSYPDLMIDDREACSACRAALMNGLLIAGDERKCSAVALGQGAQPVPGAVVLGTCLKQYHETHPHVRGCPPLGHAVAEALCGEVCAV